MIMKGSGESSRRWTTPRDTDQLHAIWEPLAALLEVHAAAEEAIFYPQLLRRGEDAEDTSAR